MPAPRIAAAATATALLLLSSALTRADDASRWSVTSRFGALAALGGENLLGQSPLLTCTVARSFGTHLSLVAVTGSTIRTLHFLALPPRIPETGFLGRTSGWVEGQFLEKTLRLVQEGIGVRFVLGSPGRRTPRLYLEIVPTLSWLHLAERFQEYDFDAGLQRTFEGHVERGIPGVQSSLFVATPLTAHFDLEMGASHEYSGEIHDGELNFDGLQGVVASVGFALHI
jgi:hypothetical protein